MAPSSPDCRRRGLIAALAAASAMLFLQPAVAASDKCETKEWEVKSEVMTRSVSEDLSVTDLKLSQCSTLLRASRADATGVKDGHIDNSTWKLTGAVHLEVDGAVMDAQAATIVLVNGLVHSVDVPAQTAQQPKKPVHVEFNSSVLDVDSATVAFTDGRIKTILALGSPAQFSYVIKKSGRQVRGRAGRIDYDAGRNEMRFSIDTRYTDGSSEASAEMLTYNIDDGSMTTRKASGTYRPDEKVPAPRTPDRATAK
jgi:lipopolysaccharide transport protein LptA